MNVSIVIHPDTDGWWADSPEVSGFVATAETLPELRQLATEGIQFALDTEEELEISEVWDTPELVGVMLGLTIHGLGSDIPRNLYEAQASTTTAGSPGRVLPRQPIYA